MGKEQEFVEAMFEAIHEKKQRMRNPKDKNLGWLSWYSISTVHRDKRQIPYKPKHSWWPC